MHPHVFDRHSARHRLEETLHVREHTAGRVPAEPREPYSRLLGGAVRLVAASTCRALDHWALRRWPGWAAHQPWSSTRLLPRRAEQERLEDGASFFNKKILRRNSSTIKSLKRKLLDSMSKIDTHILVIFKFVVCYSCWREVRKYLFNDCVENTAYQLCYDVDTLHDGLHTNYRIN